MTQKFDHKLFNLGKSENFKRSPKPSPLNLSHTHTKADPFTFRQDKLVLESLNKPSPRKLSQNHTKADPFQLKTDQLEGSIYKKNALNYEHELESMSRPYSSGRPKAQDRLQLFKQTDEEVQQTLNVNLIKPRKASANSNRI